LSGGFRGIDPAGLGQVATRLEQAAGDIDVAARSAHVILALRSHTDAIDFAARLAATINWAGDEVANLRWRADTIRTAQLVELGVGIPNVYVGEAKDRALVAAFVPSGFDFDEAYEMLRRTRARATGRELGERYSNGDDVAATLAGHQHDPNFDAIAAAFFNTIGDEQTANIPLNVNYRNWQGDISEEDAAAMLQRFAAAFAAATRSGELDFTINELFDRELPMDNINNQFDAALLFTEPGIDPAWLRDASRRIVTGESYVTWVAGPEVVSAVLTGLLNNPDVAADVLAEPEAARHVLARSTLGDQAPLIGEVLLVAATGADDARAMAATAREIIAALGSGDVTPHEKVLPYVAMIGGSYVDELAWSLSGWDNDPTYEPRFTVDRGEARLYLLETMRSTEAYAVILAAAQAWTSSVVSVEHPTSFDAYTSQVSNRTDDIGMLLTTIIDADRIIAVGDAEERMRRDAMFIDAVKGIADVAATLTGPGEVILHPSIDFLRDRADDLLDLDHVDDAIADNEQFREHVQDELRRAIYNVIIDLDLIGPDGDLDPHSLEVEQGALLNTLLVQIYAVMGRYSVDHFES
jgi:hypothetical protein